MLESQLLGEVIVFIITIVMFFFLLQKAKKNTNKKAVDLAEELLELKETLDLANDKILYLESKTIKTSYATDQIDKIKQLEEELVNVKERLSQTKVIAQEASMVKYDFLTNVSHEIRTPMNSVLVFAELLSSELTEKKYVTYASNIFNSGHKLLRLLDNVIELSKLESGSFELQEGAVDIRTLFEEIIQEKITLANKKSIKLTLEVDAKVPLSLICDAEKLKNILLNLVSNGLKFTQTGFVKVKVKVQKINTQNNSINLLVYVEDSGIGIAKENRESIFKIFQKREGSTEVELQGTGIGLSINRKMATLMNGRLSVESKLGVGSRFILSLSDLEVVLTSARDDTIDESSIDFSLVSPKGANILVIDEDEESHMIIRDSFAPSAVEVFTYSDPRDAVEKLKNSTVDLIFIDIDIFSVDENAFSKVISMMSKAPVVTLTQVSIKDVVFGEGGAKVIGHLKRPISKVELFKISIKELNSSQVVTTQENIVLRVNDELEGIDRQKARAFLLEHKKEVVSLYKNGIATNDLNAIKLFAQTLLKLATIKEIGSLVKFANTLLDNIEHFEIDEINFMMIEYKNKIKSLQNL